MAAYDDLPPIEPEKTIVYGVRWEEGKYEEDENGKKTWITPSKLIFPNAFKGEIETDVSFTLVFSPVLIRSSPDCDHGDSEVLRRDAD